MPQIFHLALLSTGLGLLTLILHIPALAVSWTSVSVSVSLSSVGTITQHVLDVMLFRYCPVDGSCSTIISFCKDVSDLNDSNLTDLCTSAKASGALALIAFLLALAAVITRCVVWCACPPPRGTAASSSSSSSSAVAGVSRVPAACPPVFNTTLFFFIVIFSAAALGSWHNVDSKLKDPQLFGIGSGGGFTLSATISTDLAAGRQLMIACLVFYILLFLVEFAILISSRSSASGSQPKYDGLSAADPSPSGGEYFAYSPQGGAVGQPQQQQQQQQQQPWGWMQQQQPQVGGYVPPPASSA